jgi:deoxyribose-phosphate aldolase
MHNYIDHTLLQPYATPDEIKTLCEEAQEFGFVSVCVNPIFVGYANALLWNTKVAVGTVIDFPLGVGGVETKAFQAVQAVNCGAQELDVVINISALKQKRHAVVEDELITIMERTNRINPKVITKAIIETCYLSDPEKKIAAAIAMDAGVDFVKTSTGFGTAGATVDDIKLIKSVVGSSGVQIKASGGIKQLDQAIELINAGATRIGTSSGVEIMQEIEDKE